MRQFKDYIWKHVQQGTIFSGVILCVFSFVLYSYVVYLLKNQQLISGLQLASYTIEESLTAGDWPLGLGYLEKLEQSGFLYDIELNAKNSKQYQFSGPFGKKPFGMMNLCKTIYVKELELSGCIKVFDISAILTLVLFAAITFIMFFFVQRYLNSRSMFFIKKVSDELKKISHLNAYKKEKLVEKDEEIVEIVSLREYVLTLLAEAEIASETAALRQIGEQVAHDIRSPLAALNMIVYNCRTLLENERVLVRKAISRITDISNNLLIRYEYKTDDKVSMSVSEPEIVSDLLSLIWTEKRLQYSEMNVNWHWAVGVEMFGVFTNLLGSDFKRIISNLIDNSIDSFKNKVASKDIFICLKIIDLSVVEISLTDNGCGIPAELLPEICVGGLSHGKESGRGLGLKHAIERINSWDGTLCIESKEQEGTRIAIGLKREATPAWFADELVITSKSRIIILDDDASIHHIWQERLCHLNINDVSLINFYKIHDLIHWQENNAFAAVYLIDYEFINEPMTTGLDLIDILKIPSQAILVTSHYDNLEIRRKCEQRNIKIIPKNFAPHIAIKLLAKT